MSVVFLVTGYPTAAGNIEGIFHRTLAEALVRAGAQVEVVSPMPRVPWPLASVSRKWADYSETAAEYRLDGVVVHRPRYWQIPRANYLGARHGSFARCLGKSVTRVPQVIHAHFAYPCGMAAVRVASRWRVPVVLTLHGSDVNVLPEKGRRARRLFLAAIKGATFVSAVSEALADRTERLAARRPTVIPIGIDLRPYGGLPDKSVARETIGIPPDVRVALFVGALVKTKGVGLLLEALERIGRPDVLGVFVGQGPLRPAISSAPRTRCVGGIPHEKIPMYMRAADVLALPSFSEGMPTVLVEAGAASLPVIATSVGGINELLSDGRGLLIPPNDVAGLVTALD
ncbi:MAG: glycosyltransferase, partial [Thermoanaerobaculia bacterium]